MDIVFRLSWLKGGAPWRRGFRLPGAEDWMGEYIDRIGRYAKCRAAGGSPDRRKARLWVCDRGPRSRPLSSEDLSARLRGETTSGRDLEILIGGAEGFAAGEIDRLKPDLRWSFGPPTLPHELAAVVAAEQVYRAWTILRGPAYHK